MMRLSPLSVAVLKLLTIVANVHGQEAQTAQQLLIGEKSTLSFTVPDDFPRGGVKFKIQFEDRQLAKGKTTRVIVDDQERFELTVVIESESLAAPIETNVVFECKGKQFSSTATLFPTKPFSQSRTALSKANIQLFDPTADTGEILRLHEIAFQSISCISKTDKHAKLLIIGEGCDQYVNSAFIESILQIASNGTNILCLKPKTTKFSFPIDSIQLTLNLPPAHANLLQSTAWQPTRGANLIQFNSVEPDSGWSLIKLQSSSTITFSSLPVIEKHAVVPAARHILHKLIEDQIRIKPEGQR